MTETVASVLGLVVFLFLAYQAGKLLNTFKHRRFTKAWKPLIGIVNGEVHEDPLGGGASSWLLGQWKGTTIHARMTPAVRTAQASNHENQFAVGVPEQDGRLNWRADRRGFTTSLDVISDDRALEDRLRDAGVLELLNRAKCRTAHFDRSSRYVFVEENVAPLWIPPPERFIVLLDVAVELARVQSTANPPDGQPQ